MQDWSKIHDAMQHVDIVLFNQFSNHCLANFVEPLRAANAFLRRKVYQWRFFTLDGAPVSSSSGLQIAPHDALAHSEGTALLLMPSYGIRELDQERITSVVRNAARRYPVLGGFDTGSWLLARAGFLDGYRATIHWDMLDAFSEAFPEIECQRQRFVIDDDRVTCSGAMAAFDLANSLIASAHGPLVAMEVAQLFMSRGMVPALPVRASGRMVGRAVALMQDYIEAPLSIPEIARCVGCTQKTLEHRMRSAMGATPSVVYRRLRLNAVLRLVQDTDLPVSEIAGRCGYESASAMTRAFKAAFGQTPQAVRQDRR
ncbi:AraC family transcriptional regulator [Tateyamaria omphalii]|uniref:GlxA family transcriptional regulator n=1 Tax=Tateyamaria omphalii TaxID=299262 RepID=UPI001673D69A|nr:helix-turn-helix domain-containing protein [Tateyamaria omphalii]GGX59178.1 AraC family transcriptional regulator [Tateyamaria omphalii]